MDTNSVNSRLSGLLAITNNTMEAIQNSTTIASMIQTTTEAADDHMDQATISMDNLYPALVQCFAIIICGYLAGRLNVITNTEAKGLNTFVGTFALPSVIFLSLAELNWSIVNWTFLLSILISKTIVFLAVGIISLLVARPLNYGRAGILAIFCTQSNDFAIGFPIVTALYSKLHPEYASYIYLLAPISLAILNPIGYVLMEISKLKAGCANQGSETRRSSIPPCPQLPDSDASGRKLLKGNCLVVMKIIESIFLNPVLLMTVLGVIGGQIFRDGLPVLLSSFLRVFGDSFSATALFLLGLRMVGKAATLQGPGFILPGILILVKLLVLPLVTRQIVNIMNAGANFTETTDLSTFGFLYGTFPAAPGVFVIAAQYNQDVDLIASSMVASTFISAPLMFISAKMITITNLNPSDYLNEFDKFAFDISIVAICCSVWMLLLFTFTRKVKKMPQRITSCLIISQLICNIGVLMWSTFEQNSGWKMYLQFYFFTIGCYSSRLWTAFLAITILFLQCRSLCFVLKLWPLFIAVAWGVPTLIVSLLFMLDTKNITPTEKRNPSFQYGNAQAAIAVFLLVMCFIVTVGCLILHQRFKKRHEKYMNLSREVSSPDTDTSTVGSSSVTNLIQEATNGHGSLHRRRQSITSSDDEILRANSGTECEGTNAGGCCSSAGAARTVVDIEDLRIQRSISNDIESEDFITSSGMCSAQFNCPAASKQQCQSLIERYREHAHDGLEPLEFDKTVDEHQTLKHTVLLILLLCSMFVGLALSVWTLIMEGMSGIYVELTFLDAFLNFGQSIIVLAVFITDTGELLLPLMKFWRKVWYGANILQLPIWSEISEETRHTCDQFITHHLDNCRKAIANDKRWRIKIYRKVFYGSAFVDWLIEVGLARDRSDATHYARRLIDGRILRHINNVHHFHDRNLLYTFCDKL
ncbi:integral membrane protein GPR155 [Toxorhynchites rutilus septentrionalis]|uniref:integral membrane protein GPR155 n=1 Tax=Toxorhynchites rutilus septentrionalis TaxID=329112 RepID=UPI002479C45B|nr:integral membrane protein GPR155 [Toxorhynchites rutilus septentrionalis]XP_055627993.1 integral membrane protein GPR155 [Toxorhynchites rutilus septentrionalis]XP_055627994.1 integral membrane protein GPR155 [Toxorhynchites rutilus septentrionalis]XP_055627995.1 integral membrane protein GPR155 [Toxorhynchites rutilus septentrionalis]XP_055627996.1 integral membrane protein GPR155 [Toxorhynchites rutilus septentrionalis]XP_055627997.1 integral membrane protein GPR155 [Toxorhynchites rutilu